MFVSTLKAHNIKLYNSSVYYLQGNPCERIIRDIGVYMRILCHTNHKSWFKYCNLIENTINENINPSTGFTPHELMTGNKLQQSVVNLSTTIEKEGETLSDEEKCRLALQILIKKSEARKDKVKRSRYKWNPIVGDEVLVKNFCLSSAQKKVYWRMNLLYRGPYKISKIFGPHTYELVDKRKKVIGRYHKSFLKPFKKI